MGSDNIIIVNPPVEEADSEESHYDRAAGSAFNRDASAIATAAHALSRTIAAFIKTHDTDLDKWPWVELGEDWEGHAVTILKDIAGFQWVLNLFAGVLSSELLGNSVEGDE